MGFRYGSAASTTIVAVNPSGVTETVIVTSPPLMQPIDSTLVLLVMFCSFTTAGSTTNINFKLRRGTSTGGTQLNAGAWQVAIGAAVTGAFQACYTDNPGAGGGTQYSLTYAGVASVGAHTVLDVSLIAFCL